MKRPVLPSIIDSLQLPQPDKRRNQQSSQTGSPVMTASSVGLQTAEIISWQTYSAVASKFTLYKVKVINHDDQSWLVDKRYSEFSNLHDLLILRAKAQNASPNTISLAGNGIHAHSALSSMNIIRSENTIYNVDTANQNSDIITVADIPEFPPKRMFGNFSEVFIASRKRDLQRWLDQVLANRKLRNDAQVFNFLSRSPTPTAQSIKIVVSPSVPGSPALFANPIKSSYSESNISLAKKDNLITPQPKTNMLVTSSNIEVNIGEIDSRLEEFCLEKEENEEDLNGDEAADHFDTGSKISNGSKPSSKVGLEDFDYLVVLGQGSFGKVILCRQKKTGAIFADKIIKKKRVAKGKQLEHTLTERSVLSYIDHPFLVKLHYAFQTDDKLHFILDYVPGGELFFHLGKFGRFSERLSKFYCAEITLALGYLHEKNIIYRDLKPENILLDVDGHIKLADFGLSKEHRSNDPQNNVNPAKISYSFCGTPEYLAPEVVSRQGHNNAVDWWSLGALLYEMLTGLPPWYCDNKKELFRHIVRSPLTFPKHLSSQAIDILTGLLDRDPDKRLGTVRGVEAVKKHPFFVDINWEKLFRKEVHPSYVPKINSAINHKEEAPDTNNFDTCFTKMAIHSPPNSPVNDGDFGTMKQSVFKDFTFINPKQIPMLRSKETGSEQKKHSYDNTEIEPIVATIEEDYGRTAVESVSSTEE